MNKYFKKFSVMFVMTLILSLGFCISAFADDNGVVGKNNFKNTAENSAKVGDILTAPEIGWKRYDDSNSKISYDSGWSSLANTPNVYQGAYTHNNRTVGKALKFRFYGTKLRLITWTAGDNSGANVKIDGIDYGNISSCSSTWRGSYMFFEKLNLNKSAHEVVITTIDKNTIVSPAASNNWFALDAIDIDDTGNLINLNESITLNKSSIDLNQGDSGQLTATVSTTTGAQVTWTSSDPSVATVDSTGKVTAIGAGIATITATTTDGSNLSASCAVNVTANNGGNTGGTTTGASSIVNIAYAKGDNTNNAGGDVSIIFNGVPDTTLSVVKTASMKSVWVGDTFSYTIVVTNTGSKTAKAVVINDSAPNHIQFMPSGITTTQGTVDPSSSVSNIVVNVGDIPPAGTVTITVPATVVL